MYPKEPIETPRQARTAVGEDHDKPSIPDLWKEMWEGTGETNRRLRWRRWDRDLDFS